MNPDFDGGGFAGRPAGRLESEAPRPDGGGYDMMNAESCTKGYGDAGPRERTVTCRARFARDFKNFAVAIGVATKVAWGTQLRSRRGYLEEERVMLRGRSAG